MKDKIYWIDRISGGVMSGKVVEEITVVYSADWDGKKFRNPSYKKVKEWTILGSDGKIYALPKEDILFEKPIN